MVSNPPPGLTSPPWSGRTKRLIALITLGLFLLLALQLLQAWTIVVIALVLSYLLNPIVNLFENYILHKIPNGGIRRTLAVILTFVALIVLLSLAVILIVPPLAVQIRDFADELPALASSYEAELEDTLSRPISIGNRNIVPWEELSALVGNNQANGNNFDIVATVRDTAAALTVPVFNIATIALTVIFNILFMFVIMFYMMKDGHLFIHKIDSITPVEYQGDVRRMIYELGLIWNAYLRGQLLLGFIVGIETVIAATILGLPQPLVLGLIAGILEFIPNLGPILSAVPAILLALISPSTTIPGLDGVLFALVVAAVYTFIQQSEALFLVPRIMGGHLDLHPLAILISVLSGAAIAGILGIILAAPIVATMRLLLVYIWGKLLDIDPFTKAPLPVYMPPQTEHALSASSTPVLSGFYYPEQDGEIIDD